MTDPQPPIPHDGPAPPATPLPPEPLEISADMIAPPEPVESRIDFERGMSVWPLVSLALIVANVAVFGWELSRGALDNQTAIIQAGALHRDSVLRGEIWRLPWSVFLHGGVAHLIGNCLILYILGMGVEHAAGRVVTAGTYALAGLTGAALSLAMQPGPSVGASGAIFGLLGALIVFLYRYRHFYFVRDKQIGVVLFVWAVYQIATGFLDPQIDNMAHVGGFVGGAAAAAFVRPRVTPPTPGFAVRVG